MVSPQSATFPLIPYKAQAPKTNHWPDPHMPLCKRMERERESIYGNYEREDGIVAVEKEATELV